MHHGLFDTPTGIKTYFDSNSANTNPHFTNKPLHNNYGIWNCAVQLMHEQRCTCASVYSNFQHYLHTIWE